MSKRILSQKTILGPKIIFGPKIILGPKKILVKNSLKNADPPLRSNSDIFAFENILMVEDPLGQTPEKGNLGAVTLKTGILSVFLFRRESKSDL